MDHDAEQMLLRVFRHFLLPTSRQRPAHPDWPGVTAWEATTCDSIQIRGWAHRPQPCHGTVLLLHPFTCHSLSPWIVALAAHLRDRFHLATIGLDFRFHGLSDDRFPTFGTAEMWDIQAAMDWAKAQAFQPPFIVWGESLGAMAAARTAISDSRIRAAFLKAPPAWPARVLADIFSIVDETDYAALNRVYGWDIVGDGDIRHHDPGPSHRPLICYTMGEHDHHDTDYTRTSYSHWYRGTAGTLEAWPGDAPQHATWFVTIAGAGHEFDGHDFPLLNHLTDRFFQYVLS